MQDAIVHAIHPYLVTLLEVLAAIIMGAIGWGLKRLWKVGLAWFYAHTSAANQAWIESLAKEAYAHAERFYKNVNGDEKLNAAVNYMMKKVNLQTIGLTREDLKGAIQRAWQDYNQYKQPTDIGKSA